ncbi:transposase [Natrialbaceae archaeon GCM10025896]
MFTEVNRRFIRFASTLGFFDRAYDYALDPTWITWGGDGGPGNEEMMLIENPEECDTGKGWCFTALAVMDLDARFALGVDLAPDKSQRTGQFRRMLRVAAREGGVGRVHIDREFFDGDAVRLCRAVAKRNWVIQAKIPKKGAVASVINETPIGESEFYKGVPFSDVTPNPNVYVHSVPEWLREQNGGHPHMAFLTDLTPEDVDLSDIYETYLKRWSIETFFRQLKHEFASQTESASPTLRLFLLNVATLFYNMHALMNRAVGPEYGLRLDVPYYDVLISVVEATFTRTGATER